MAAPADRLHTCVPLSPPGPGGTVEPLLLPEPGHVFPPCSGRSRGCSQPIAADLAVMRAVLAGDHPGLLSPPRDEPGRVRYRWTVGHHAAVAVWCLLTEALRGILREPVPSADAIAEAASLLDAYSVLFLYSGSCSAEQYEATVRRDMRAWDPAFSGRWATDHEPVPALLRQVRKTLPTRTVAPLCWASQANNRVHVAVARKLVPDGESLLKAAGRCPGAPATTAERHRYDEFFRMCRRPVCRRTFTAQLTRRLAQVLRDLAAPGGDPLDSGGLPDGCRDLQYIAENGTTILYRLACFATRGVATTPERRPVP